jgi:hypothetical protein
MKNENFVDMVKKHFGYLESEYNFKIVLENISTSRPGTDGVVKYASDSTLIIIDSEAAQAAVRFVRIQDDERYYLDPVSIHEYMATNNLEKQILLSKNPNDKVAADSIFTSVFLLSTAEWKDNRQDTYLQLEARLRNYAAWLRKNEKICLMGDFSRWPAFYEYKINRLIATEIQKGGSELVKAIVKDESGKPQIIERPIFQNERNHLDRLRKEHGTGSSTR